MSDEYEVADLTKEDYYNTPGGMPCGGPNNGGPMAWGKEGCTNPQRWRVAVHGDIIFDDHEDIIDEPLMWGRICNSCLCDLVEEERTLTLQWWNRPVVNCAGEEFIDNEIVKRIEITRLSTAEEILQGSWE